MAAPSNGKKTLDTPGLTHDEFLNLIAIDNGRDALARNYRINNQVHPFILNMERQQPSLALHTPNTPGQHIYDSARALLWAILAENHDIREEIAAREVEGHGANYYPVGTNRHPMGRNFEDEWTDVLESAEAAAAGVRGHGTVAGAGQIGHGRAVGHAGAAPQVGGGPVGAGQVGTGQTGAWQTGIQHQQAAGSNFVMQPRSKGKGKQREE